MATFLSLPVEILLARGFKKEMPVRPTNKVVITPEIQSLIDRKALFVVNHSGGKDSQAMYNALWDVIPQDRLIVIHAQMPGVEWEGTSEYIHRSVSHPLYEVKSSTKTFFEMVEHRKMFPSPSYRQCTSDLKAQPIDKKIRALLNEQGILDPQGKLPIVNCMGLRGLESPNRDKAVTFKFDEKSSKAGREWYDWLPIHHYTLGDVFAEVGHTLQEWHERIILYKAGYKEEALKGWNLHWVYAAGMSRKSCKICIMSSADDLVTSRQIDPANFAHWTATERRLDQSVMIPDKKTGKLFLDQIADLQEAKGPVALVSKLMSSEEDKLRRKAEKVSQSELFECGSKVLSA